MEPQYSNKTKHDLEINNNLRSSDLFDSDNEYPLTQVKQNLDILNDDFSSIVNSDTENEYPLTQVKENPSPIENNNNNKSFPQIDMNNFLITFQQIVNKNNILAEIIEEKENKKRKINEEDVKFYENLIKSYDHKIQHYHNKIMYFKSLIKRIKINKF